MCLGHIAMMCILPGNSNFIDFQFLALLNLFIYEYKNEQIARAALLNRCMEFCCSYLGHTLMNRCAYYLAGDSDFNFLKLIFAINLVVNFMQAFMRILTVRLPFVKYDVCFKIKFLCF